MLHHLRKQRSRDASCQVVGFAMSRSLALRARGAAVPGLLPHRVTYSRPDWKVGGMVVTGFCVFYNLFFFFVISQGVQQNCSNMNRIYRWRYTKNKPDDQCLDQAVQSALMSL